MATETTSPKTISEALFEEYCGLMEIRFDRICANDGPTPDYEIFPSGQRVISEIKQIDPNDDDIQAEEQLSSGQVAMIGSHPGKRIRAKINDAAPQLRILAKGNCPAILVLYNNVSLARYTDSYGIKSGMYGVERVGIDVPADYSAPPQVAEMGFGPKRKMTPTHNTSISAVAVMLKDYGRDQEFLIYHNVFAAIPLATALFPHPMVKQFTLEEKRPLAFQQWTQIA